MALGNTSEQLYYHNNFIMKPSNSQQGKKMSVDDGETPSEEPSMLFAMRNKFRKKIAMEMNIAQKGKHRTKNKHLENENSLLQLCEKNKKFIQDFNENTKENSRRKTSSEPTNRLKKLPPISHYNKNTSDNNKKTCSDIAALDNDVSTVSAQSSLGIRSHYQGITPLRNNGLNTLTNGKSRLSSIPSNYDYNKTINDLPPDVSKLHLVRDKRKLELKKVNAKHSSPTTMMEQELLQSQSEIRKPLRPDKELGNRPLNLRNPISSTKVVTADFLVHGFENSLSDFEKWQMERDKEKQLRLGKVSKHSHSGNMLLDPPLKMHTTSPSESVPSEPLQFPAKPVRKKVKRRQENISSSPSVGFYADPHVPPLPSQQSKEEMAVKPIGMSPDLRGVKVNNKSCGSPNFPVNPVISGLNKPVLVRHDGRSNASSRTSTRNAFYVKTVAPVEGELDTYQKIAKTDSHFSSNCGKSDFNNDALAIPEQESVTLQPCRICGRKFRLERLDKHVAVCSKATGKRRKVFNMSKVRKKGTDMEKFTVAKGAASSRLVPPRKSNWRSQHEDFIKTIRHAKMITSFVKDGGKLADLPPPEPSVNPDYVTCDYCQRRFAPNVAERHIPRCKDIKSRPPPPKSRVPRNKQK